MVKRLRALLVCATLFLLLGLGFAEGAIGIFEGVVVQGSSGEAGTYVYIQGRNGNLRRVRIKGARVYYADSVPVSERVKNPEECLRESSQVRITAEQDRQGEWKAREIMILKIPRPRVETVLRVPVT